MYHHEDSTIIMYCYEDITITTASTPLSCELSVVIYVGVEMVRLQSPHQITMTKHPFLASQDAIEVMFVTD